MDYFATDDKWGTTLAVRRERVGELFLHHYCQETNVWTDATTLTAVVNVTRQDCRSSLSQTVPCLIPPKAYRPAQFPHHPSRHQATLTFYNEFRSTSTTPNIRPSCVWPRNQEADKEPDIEDNCLVLSFIPYWFFSPPQSAPDWALLKSSRAVLNKRSVTCSPGRGLSLAEDGWAQSGKVSLLQAVK